MSKALKTELRRLLKLHHIELVVHGAAPGADVEAGAVAGSMGLEVELHPAKWTEHGKAAGPIRNREMAEAGANICIAFPGGRGTEVMVQEAERHGIFVVRVDGSRTKTTHEKRGNK